MGRSRLVHSLIIAIFFYWCDVFLRSFVYFVVCFSLLELAAGVYIYFEGRQMRLSFTFFFKIEAVFIYGNMRKSEVNIM